jgi:asparagine synthase (glutamine-hydrolysing)
MSRLCRFAKQHVTVAVGGDGADELFCGYDTFRAVRLAEHYARCVPRPLHRAIRAVCAWLPDGHGYMSFPFRLRRMLQGLSYGPRLWNPVWLGGLEPAAFEDCFRDPASQEEIYAEAIELWDSSPSRDVIDRTTQFYVKLYFQDGILTKLDRAGMQHALEVRCPFLDVDLVEFVRRLPQSLKFRGSRGKYLLRKSMQSVLPPGIVDQAKHGFPFPVAKWLQAGNIPHEAIRPLSGQRAEFLASRWRSHRQGRRDERLLLWSQWVMNRFLTRNA